MRILSTAVLAFTSDIASAIVRYSALTGETIPHRFAVPERGVEVAILGNLTVIGGPDSALALFRGVRGTFTVDSLDEFVAGLQSASWTVLQPPGATPAGRNMIARDGDGNVFEFVELRARE